MPRRGKSLGRKVSVRSRRGDPPPLPGRRRNARSGLRFHLFPGKKKGKSRLFLEAVWSRPISRIAGFAIETRFVFFTAHLIIPFAAFRCFPPHPRKGGEKVCAVSLPLPLVQVLRMYRQQKKFDVKDENFKKEEGGGSRTLSHKFVGGWVSPPPQVEGGGKTSKGKNILQTPLCPAEGFHQQRGRKRTKFVRQPLIHISSDENRYGTGACTIAANHSAIYTCTLQGSQHSLWSR